MRPTFVTWSIRRTEYTYKQNPYKLYSRHEEPEDATSCPAQKWTCLGIFNTGHSTETKSKVALSIHLKVFFGSNETGRCS
jgi:hypothetical protein